MDKLRDALCTTIHERLGWPSEAAAELAEYAHVVSYERSATVFRAGEPSDLLYLLINGEVRLYYGNGAGSRLLVSIVRNGELFGIAGLQTGEGRMPQPEQSLTACAAACSKVAVLVRARVARLLQQLPSADLLRICEHADSRWKALCHRLVAFMTQGVRSRLAYSIMEVAQDFGIQDARGTLITLRLSHEDFAEMIGASRPMVSKCINDLKQAKVFVKEGGRYIVQREDMLARMVGGVRREEQLSGLISALRSPGAQRPDRRLPIARQVEHRIGGAGDQASAGW